MTTPRTHSLVSLAATLALTLALVGCAGASSRFAPDAPVPSAGAELAVHFDNGARERVHVYLVGAQRQWLLGRVEPGARATLRIPEEALAEGVGFVRLAVLTGQHVSLRVTSEPRAAITMAQPAAVILTQRWSFSQTNSSGQLAPLLLGHVATAY